MLPCLARLPQLLEDHYAGARAALGLRLLGSQGAGVVLFSLFPTASRGEASLPAINFDALPAYAPWLTNYTLLG